MKGFIKRNMALIAVFAVIIALCASLLCLNFAADSANAADEFTEAGRNVEVGHVTDVHYYPFRFTYTGDVPTDTESADYFYNWIMDKSTKMWLEGEMIFDEALAKFAKNAPDYIVVSGDVAQDGELVGHIDVANKLRKLQNYVRETKPGFQIFVVMGNHDLYNPETYRFDNATGTRTTFYYTTRIEAVQIYAGLGYPNMTVEEADAFYAPLYEDGTIPDGYKYVRSNLSTDFKYIWQFVKDVDGKAEVFEPVEDDDELTLSKLIAANKVNILSNNKNLGKLCYSKTELGSNGSDINVGEMSFVAARKDGFFTVLGLDVIMSNAIGGHVLGGEFTLDTQAWLEANAEFARQKGAETLMVATAHHSFIPHWDMEEEITTGFIMYNWQEGSDFLADYGVRYVYTGHQHANDTVSKISFNGNQLIDMESSANISVGSQVKVTKIVSGHINDVYAEKAYLKAYQNEEVKFDETKEAGEFGRNEIVKKLCDKVYKDDKFGYIANNKLSEFIDVENVRITNYSRYAQRRVYDNIVANYMNKFLQKGIVDSLGDMIKGIKPIKVSFLTIDFSRLAPDIMQIANNLIEAVNTQMLADYTYKGETERLKADDMKIFGYLEELVYDVVYGKVAGDVDVFTVFMDAYMRHNLGTNYVDVDDMPEGYRAVLDKVISGEFVDTLLKKLLDDKTGLMRLINFLSETTLDLSKDVSKNGQSIIESLLMIVGCEGYSLKNFDLGGILKKAGGTELVGELIVGLGVQIDLVNMTLPEIVNDIVSKYLTDNFKQGLGEYAYNIVTAFGTDGGHIDVTTAENGGRLLTVVGRETDYTFKNTQKSDIVTVANGKLPSMLTNNFGSDTATTRNFTWFTDRRITDGAIEYTTDTVNHTNAIKVAAKTEVYGTTKPLIDLGIWCQSGYTELSRNTVKLKDLSAGTTYAYRAGSPSKNYWSEWYTFTTGTESGAFEALIASDLQASTRSSYQRIDKIYKDVINNQFANGVSFMLNPGDVVDNGRNLSQYQWLYNSSPDVYASYAMVVAAGNHDNKYFDIEKAKNSEPYGGVTEGAMGTKDNNPNYNYLWSHYNLELAEEQTQKGGFYYSFDYSKVHFIVLNTNDVETVAVDGQNVTGLASAQYDWLKADLEKNSSSYKVVLMHKSLYSEGSHSYDNDVVGMRAQLTPLFADCGVNLVIAGHDHVYNETFYLDRDGNKVKTNANGKNEIVVGNGTLYVTMGTMGEKFYNWVENDKVLTSTGTDLHNKDSHLSDPTFGKLVFDGDKLYYYGYQYLRDNQEIKSIAKAKSGLSAGAIAGIVIACVAAAAGITVAVILIVKRKKNSPVKEKGAETAPVEEK